MDALEMILLYDYYGNLLTDRQRECFEMRYNQDLSLGEIAQILGISRQGVHDNLSRTEALLRRMEENIGCVARDLKNRATLERIHGAVEKLQAFPDKDISDLAGQIASAVQALEE